MATFPSLIRTLCGGDGDLLSLLPKNAYEMDAGNLGYSRRSIKLFNEPSLVQEILNDKHGIFPKSDLMVSALERLIGDSIFVSDGERWRRQRAMIDPAFSQMRLEVAFQSMVKSVDGAIETLGEYVASNEVFSLDQTMSHLAANIICETVFSTSLKSEIAREVFDDFAIFERDVAQVKIWRLIVDPAWTKAPQSDDVLAACARIRKHIGILIDTHLDEENHQTFNDIASIIIATRDSETGEGFSREELIDQLGVFFLAGHETTASALTWLFYIVSAAPTIKQRMRDEIHTVAGDAPLTLAHIKKLSFVRAAFRETLRLYPPVPMMVRETKERDRFRKRPVRRGAQIVISPFHIQRHDRIWKDPDVFDPGRWQDPTQKEALRTAYLPFSKGPRVCSGASFAMVEGVAMLFCILKTFEVLPVEGQIPQPVAHLTLRSEDGIYLRFRPR